jgi:hypothetical protein
MHLAAALGRVLSVKVPCSDCTWICPYKPSYSVQNIPLEAVQDAHDTVIAGRQKEFEVTLLEPKPEVARAMIRDAAATADKAMRALETERARFHQWHEERPGEIDRRHHAIAPVASEMRPTRRQPRRRPACPGPGRKPLPLHHRCSSPAAPPRREAAPLRPHARLRTSRRTRAVPPRGRPHPRHRSRPCRDRGRHLPLLHTDIEHPQRKIAQLGANLLPRRLLNLRKKS